MAKPPSPPSPRRLTRKGLLCRGMSWASGGQQNEEGRLRGSTHDGYGRVGAGGLFVGMPTTGTGRLVSPSAPIFGLVTPRRRSMDSDGYPDDQELQRIREWPGEDFSALMEFVRTLWKWNDWGWSQQGYKYRISTGGWSGNESLISALEGNMIFWMMCWHQSRRGGHYTFVVPKATPGPAGEASEEGRG